MQSNMLEAKKVNDKKTVLFIVKSSKKINTGFYAMNSYVVNSSIIKESFNSSFFVMYAVSKRSLLLKYLYTLVNSISYTANLFYLMLKRRPKLVYFTISPVKAFLRDVLYIFVIKLFKSKVVYHLHGKGIRKKASDSFIYKILYQWAYKDVDVICLSKKLFYDVSFLPVNKLWVVPNAIPKYGINETDIINKELNEPIKILFLSNLIKSKGVEDFINGLIILIDEGYNVKGLIVGSEYEYSKDMLHDLIGTYGNKFDYFGPLFGLEKNKIFQSSDIFVFPTYYEYETWGLVLLEAMQYGLPVITTDEAAITDMIKDNENGFIVDKKNPDMVADKVKKLINNPNMMKEMSLKNHRKYKEFFTMDVFEINLCETLESI